MCRARYHILILITLTLATPNSEYLSYNCETEKKMQPKRWNYFLFSWKKSLNTVFKNERIGHIVHLSKPLQGLPSFKAGFKSLYLLHGKHTSLTLYWYT